MHTHTHTRHPILQGVARRGALEVAVVEGPVCTKEADIDTSQTQVRDYEHNKLYVLELVGPFYLVRARANTATGAFLLQRYLRRGAEGTYAYWLLQSGVSGTGDMPNCWFTGTRAKSCSDNIIAQSAVWWVSAG